MRKTAYCSPFAWWRQRGIVQMLLAMKLTVILLTAALLNVSANGLAQKITYSASGTSLEKVFTEIEKQTGFVFLYKEGLLINTKPVSIKAKDLPWKISWKNYCAGNRWHLQDCRQNCIHHPASHCEAIATPVVCCLPPAPILRFLFSPFRSK